MIDLAGGDAVGSGSDADPPYSWSTAKILVSAQTVVDAGGPEGLS